MRGCNRVSMVTIGDGHFDPQIHAALTEASASHPRIDRMSHQPITASETPSPAVIS